MKVLSLRQQPKVLDDKVRAKIVLLSEVASLPAKNAALFPESIQHPQPQSTKKLEPDGTDEITRNDGNDRPLSSC